MDLTNPVKNLSTLTGAFVLAAIMALANTGCRSSGLYSDEEAMVARVQSMPAVETGSVDAVGPRQPATSFFTPEARIEVQTGNSLLEQKIARLVERQTAYLERLANAQNDVDRDTLEQRIVEICREYEAIIAENPYELLPYLVYGKLLRQIGERERAHEIFQRANAVDTRVPVVKQQLGNYFAEEGIYPQALLFFMAAIDLAPHEAVYHYSLGELFYIYREDFLNDGAYSSTELDKLMQEAFREAALLAPENADFQFRYGESFYDVENADWFVALAHWEVFQERAINQTQADAIRLHRARVMLKLGWNSEARKLLAEVATPALEATRDALMEQAK